MEIRINGQSSPVTLSDSFAFPQRAVQMCVDHKPTRMPSQVCGVFRDVHKGSKDKHVDTMRRI